MVKATNGGQHGVWKLPFRPIVVALNYEQWGYVEYVRIILSLSIVEYPQNSLCHTPQ